MSLPQSLGSYRDCQDLLTKAASSSLGVRVCFASEEAAIQKRSRIHYFRVLDRKSNAKTYPEGHHLHGTSAYDDFYCSIRVDTAGEWWLYIQRRSDEVLAIEPLGDENLIEVESTEVKFLEDHTFDPTAEGLS